MGGLLQELKRRKVFRIAVVYAVVAWLLIQIVATVLPILQLPEWTVTFFTLLFMIGFPIAIILAWAYEVTPEGIRPDTATELPTAPSSSVDRKLIYATFLLVLLVAGFQVVDRFVLIPSESSPAIVRSTSPETGSQTTRTSIVLGMVSDLGGQASVAISPDGTRVAYMHPENQTSNLFVRDLEQLEPTHLATLSRVSGSATPFFAPDSERIAYRDDNELKVVSVNGGSERSLVSGLTDSILSWDSDDSIVYTDGRQGELQRIQSVGGIPERLSLDLPQDRQHLIPHVLPGGRAILFNMAEGRTIRRGGVLIADLESGEVRTLIDNAYAGRYASSGHIVFMRSSTLWAAPFDLERMVLTGPQVPVLEGIQAIDFLGLARYSFSDNGRLVYLAGSNLSPDQQQRRLVWVSRTGETEAIPLESNLHRDPQISPDGNTISFTVPDQTGGRDIWTYDLRRGVQSRLTFTGAAEAALWAPDGQSLLYGTREKDWGIWTIAADGTGQPEILISDNDIVRAETISTDGNQIVYRKGIITNDLYIADRGDIRETDILLSSESSLSASTISPDGNWIAYTSYETGRLEVYVRPFPNVNDGKWQISTDGGVNPRWDPSGNSIYYITSQFLVRLMEVPISTDQDFEVGVPEPLFDGDFDRGAPILYDVAPDGQRFLMNEMVRDGEESQQPNVLSIIFVDNWFQELHRLAPPAIE